MIKVAQPKRKPDLTRIKKTVRRDTIKCKVCSSPNLMITGTCQVCQNCGSSMGCS